MRDDHSGKLGEILVRQGVLIDHQVRRILNVQRDSHRPFGDLAERLFGIDSRQVERAWQTQFLQRAERVDPADHPLDSKALERVSRRQAWQFRFLPLGFEADHLVAATEPRSVHRAVRFAWRLLGQPTRLVIATPQSLCAGLERAYGRGAMTWSACARPVITIHTTRPMVHPISARGDVHLPSTVADPCP